MRKVCEVYLISSSASDERGVELAFPVSQYEMMDAFEQIYTKSPGDVYWQVDEFYCFDYLAPHLDESMSIFEFNSLTEQLSKLDERQETALEGLLQMQVEKHMQENSGPITAQELMMLASNVDRCQVLADVNTDEALGKFYVENGFRDDLDALPDSAYAEAVSAAVDNGLLYGKSATVIDPNGDMTRAEMAAIINRSFGCYVKADISKYKDVSKDKWYFEDVAMAVQMGTYNGRSASSMAPDAPISRQEAMTVVARALELDYDSYSKTDLSAFSDRSEISNWALPYVRAMVGADYIHGRGKILAPQDNITRAEFAQIFYNIIGTYIVSKGTYDKDIKGSVLIRTDEVTLKDMTVDGDLIIGCGAADGKITLDNVTVTGRLLVWGGGTKAVYCNNGTQMPEVVVARVDDAVKVIYDRDSTLAVIDTIKVRVTERAKQHKETEVIFYDVSGLREAQKQLNAIVADNQIDITAPAHLYALVGESSVKAEFRNNSKGDTYKVEIRRNKDNALIADAFELAAGKSILTLTLLEAPEFGNVDCTVTVTAFRDGKQIGSMQTELTLHAAYLWPKEVQ